MQGAFGETPLADRQNKYRWTAMFKIIMSNYYFFIEGGILQQNILYYLSGNQSCCQVMKA